MIILLYSDKGYEKMVESFLLSRDYIASNITVLYYTVGFDSDLEFSNLIKKRWEFDDSKPDLTYYKAEILIDGLNYSDKVCFMDCDILLGRRFSPDTIVNNNFDYPICCKGPVEFVWIWENTPDGNIITHDEKKLMNFFGIDSRLTYRWASMISYNEQCRDFLEEWDSVLKNQYLLKRKKEFFPFREETALNIIFFKRKIDYHLDLIFFNTEKFESFLKVESEEGFRKHVQEYHTFTLDNAIYETCNDSSIVQFYHGMKCGPELEKTLKWMKENSIH